MAEDTEAEKEAQATTQTILDEAEATETVVDTEEEAIDQVLKQINL